MIGAVGIELPLLDFFKPIIKQVQSSNHWAYGFLTTNSGIFVAHPTKWMNVGRSLEFFGFEKRIIKAVKEGREASQLKVSKISGRKTYYLFVPIQIGATDKPWSLAIHMPVK